MNNSIKLFSLFLCVFTLLCAKSAQAQVPSPILEVDLLGSAVRGLPISWGEQEGILLQQNGAFIQFAQGDVRGHRTLEQSFHPAPASEMVQHLQTEFGRPYQVVAAGPYLVVAPAESASLWGNRFTELYGGFQHYFSTRGVSITAPPFPLVAIVFRTREEFDAYAARQGNSVGGSTLGYYSPMSNRIALYDLTSAGNSWHSTASTLIHEATHQTAYNVGLHDRLAETPLWVIEGLATLFEAPGVYDPGRNRKPEDRINPGRKAGFQRGFASPDEVAQSLDLMLTNDQWFEHDPDRAYALAWGLTHYLSERDMAAYSRMLRDLARRPLGETYPPQQRMSDFQRWTNTRPDLLAPQIWNHLNANP